jgi:phage-related protein
MLDNLKLGYGGTSQEMYRLLSDAAKLDAQFAKTAKFSIDNKGHLTAGYADIVKAIHIVQDEMAITGVTSKEAATTSQGSASMMKAAWENLVTGMADGEADFEELFGNVVTSAETLFENVLPIAEQALSSITDLIEMAAPMIIEKIPGLAERILPSLLGAATSILNALASALPGVFDALSSTVLQISDTLTTTLKDGLLSEDSVSKLVESALNLVLALSEAILPNLPLIIESGLTLIIALAQGIAESIPELIPTIVDVVLQIVDTLTDPKTLTSLVDAAIAIIFALAEALIDGDVIGTLLAKAPEIVQNLVTAITDNAGKLLTAAGDLIVKLAEGLVNKEKLKEIKTAAKDIIDSLKTGITDLWTDIKGVGSNIVAGVKQGISEAWTNMKEWLSTLFGDIITIAKNILGIKSPSKEFKTIGKFLDEGLAQGIKDYADVAIGETENLVKGVEDAAQIKSPTISITPKLETATATGVFDGVDFNALATTSIEGVSRIAHSVDYDSIVKAVSASFEALVDMFTNGEAVVKVDNSRDLRRALNA